MAKQNRERTIVQGRIQPHVINNMALGNGQHIDMSSQFQCKMGNMSDYQETFDMRSVFLIIKTLLKESQHDESLIYMKYEELQPILNRESVINEILNSEDI